MLAGPGRLPPHEDEMKDAFLEELTASVLEFRDQRNWEQFHSLKNLSAGLSIEASELQELFLWKTDEEAREFSLSPEGRNRIGEELSDILLYLLLVANKAGIDLEAASSRKLAINAEKYPVEKSYNSARKYSEL